MAHKIAGLLEWPPEQDDSKTWGEHELLEDSCLTRPLCVKALLGTVEADEAMLASNHPTVVKHDEGVDRAATANSLAEVFDDA
ncbi:hypothetical protein [Haliangium sp.]|uniref:hypothetical protein n=1 Tax=Haliangium sp. TaxID=2663208 RepID=UPI003D0E5AFF